MNDSVSRLIIQFFLQTYRTQQADTAVVFCLLQRVFLQLYTRHDRAKEKLRGPKIVLIKMCE